MSSDSRSKTSQVDQLERLSRQRDPQLGSGDRGFFAAVAAVILVGVLIVAVAREGRQLDHPTTADSWSAHVEIFDCVEEAWLDVPTETVTSTGLRLRTDGTLSIEPISDDEAGGKATLGRVFAATGGSLGDEVFDLGSGEVLAESGAWCNNEEALLQVHRWSAGDDAGDDPEVVTTDLADIRLNADGDTMVIALAPQGASVTPRAFNS